jgi:hypothetical protein
MTNAAPDKLLEEKTQPSEPPLPVLQGDALPNIAPIKLKRFRFMLLVQTLVACGVTLMVLWGTGRIAWRYFTVLRQPVATTNVFIVFGGVLILASGAVAFIVVAAMWHVRAVTKRSFETAEAELEEASQAGAEGKQT